MQTRKIVIRKFAFEFPNDLNPKWSPKHIVRSHMFNGLSLTMPYLEPFLIKTMRDVANHIDEATLLDDIRDFNHQETNHYQCHLRLNELLKANGYPELASVESRIAASYVRLSKRSLRTRLAYGAGFESITNGFTTWFINKRRQLFGGACPYVSSFWLMHVIEETEHRTVAFDAYMAYSGQYLPRFIGVFHGSFHVLGYALVGMFTALKKEGGLYKPRRLVEIGREIFSLLYNVSPALLRALLPWYNPRREKEPQWMKDWVKGYAMLPPNALIPLVDTNHKDIPVPFPSQSFDQE